MLLYFYIYIYIYIANNQNIFWLTVLKDINLDKFSFFNHFIIRNFLKFLVNIVVMGIYTKFSDQWDAKIEKKIYAKEK